MCDEARHGASVGSLDTARQRPVLVERRFGRDRAILAVTVLTQIYASRVEAQLGEFLLFAQLWAISEVTLHAVAAKRIAVATRRWACDERGLWRW